VLFLVGLINKRRIREFKRTRDFTVDDFNLLERLVSWFGKLVATPHVLSQVSDLTDLSGKERGEIRRLFKLLVEEQIEESYDPSSLLVCDPVFNEHGLADSAVAKVGSRGILVLTADNNLFGELQRRNMDAVNFNHVRPIEWD
jgi:hypothetical protein